jgi:ADP-dependent NAD(P)H-hydrate dehydratase
MTELDLAWLAGHPLPFPQGETDKNKRGRVVAAGGSEKVPGALLLTGEAAFRAGAGKVQMATVERASIALGVRMPEAAAIGLPANAAGELGSAAGDGLARLAEQCDALVLGPGMAPDADTDALFRALIPSAPSDGALLLDASMIPVIRLLESNGAAWRRRRVITPHFGEMAVLMDCDEESVTPDLAQQAAARFSATVVLKASETWIATPDAAMLHYRGGGSGLATGGSGDVLSGVIGGLLARGAAARDAAAWGVWLHGEAGRSLADRVGAIGFLARELLPIVPELLRDHHPKL